MYFSQMILSNPIWSSMNKTYSIHISNPETITYSELRNTSGNEFFNEPDINKKEFQEVINDFITEFIAFSKVTFSTPIKNTNLIKRLKHIFTQISNQHNYGKQCLITWKPTKIVISSALYEIYWDVTTVLFDDSIEYEKIDPDTTTIVEPVIEIQEISNISPEQDYTSSSRALLKKKVRETRLKVAIVKLKAEKLAAKYFRRYGNDLNVSDESDLSSDSDE